jgi:transcriptional regulator NrdR family protein
MARMHCTYCHSDKHTVVNCPHTMSGPSNRRRLRCTYCRKTGHHFDVCPHRMFTGLSRRDPRNNDKHYHD